MHTEKEEIEETTEDKFDVMPTKTQPAAVTAIPIEQQQRPQHRARPQNSSMQLFNKFQQHGSYISFNSTARLPSHNNRRKKAWLVDSGNLVATRNLLLLE